MTRNAIRSDLKLLRRWFLFCKRLRHIFWPVRLCKVIKRRRKDTTLSSVPFSLRILVTKWTCIRRTLIKLITEDFSYCNLGLHYHFILALPGVLSLQVVLVFIFHWVVYVCSSSLALIPHVYEMRSRVNYVAIFCFVWEIVGWIIPLPFKIVAFIDGLQGSGGYVLKLNSHCNVAIYYLHGWGFLGLIKLTQILTQLLTPGRVWLFIPLF